MPLLTPHMTAKETALLASLCHDGCNVLEFGCGGSTQFFFEQGALHVVSVESDPDWIREMRQNPVTGYFLRKKRWWPQYADIGPVKKWGYPINATPSPGWSQYHQTIWDTLPYDRPDIVLIDGRFRVACLCQALLREKHGSPLVVVHDFWERDCYHIVLALCEIVAKADSMAVLRKGESATPERLRLVLGVHKHDPR